MVWWDVLDEKWEKNQKRRRVQIALSCHPSREKLQLRLVARPDLGRPASGDSAPSGVGDRRGPATREDHHHFYLCP